MRIDGALVALGLAFASSPASAQPALRLTLEARPEKVFDSRTDACAPVDMPDINPRAVRTDDGVALFALHYEARALRGPDLDRLRIDCAVALPSGGNEDPATHDGRRFVTSLWALDGRRVAALVHNEYHAENHPGRCASSDGLACWWNSVLAFRSDDGARRFAPMKPLVVAAAPFRQDVGQTRHRGFFSPSNMVAHGAHVYAFVATTGWDGQKFGACLMRNADPLNAAGWRAFDGRDFTVRWSDPYAPGARAPAPCAPVETFGFPVGALVRHRPSGAFVAVWEAPRVAGKFPLAGFYYATSRDLLNWSAPALLMPGAVIHDACDGGRNRDGTTIAYPSLIDHTAHGRNFDDAGDTAYLYYTRIRNHGCAASAERVLLRARVTIARPGGGAR